MSVPNGQKAIARLVLFQSWAVTIQKKFGFVFSRSFLKKIQSFIMLIKKQNNLNQNSLSINSNGFPCSSETIYPVSLLEILRLF